MMDTWWGFWIRVFFWTRLRLVVNEFQRLITLQFREPREDLPAFETPADVENYLKGRYDWGPDQLRLWRHRIPIDFSRRPEVFQARLTDGTVKDEGDCDDVHTWARQALEGVPGVAWAHLFSACWKGGGHTFCVYEYKARVYVFNYRIAGPLELVDVPAHMLDWTNNNREKDEEPVARLKWFVLETKRHRLLSATPKACSLGG
jgi:hypothetical protein